jgi:hypothetical protein
MYIINSSPALQKTSLKPVYRKNASWICNAIECNAVYKSGKKSADSMGNRSCLGDHAKQLRKCLETAFSDSVYFFLANGISTLDLAYTLDIHFM